MLCKNLSSSLFDIRDFVSQNVGTLVQYWYVHFCKCGTSIEIGYRHRVVDLVCASPAASRTCEVVDLGRG